MNTAIKKKSYQILVIFQRKSPGIQKKKMSNVSDASLKSLKALIFNLFLIAPLGNFLISEKGIQG